MITRQMARAFTEKLIIICAAVFLILNHPVYGIYSSDYNKVQDKEPPAENNIPSLLFNDINEKQWFYKSIHKAAQLGVIDTKAAVFRPYDFITTAEFLKIIALSDGLTESAGTPWYLNYVEYALNSSWIDVDTVKNYEEPMTKIVAAQIICGFLKLDTDLSADSPSIFIDTGNKYAQALYRESLIVPYTFREGCRFGPSDHITRAEAVELAMKAVAYKNSPSGYKEQTSHKKTSGIRLPVLMYHNVGTKSSEWGPMSISPEKLRMDMGAIKNSGYNTILFEELLSFVDGYADLPENPVIITFDDGYKGVYDYAFPILRELNMKFVACIVGSTIGDPEYNIRYKTQHLDIKAIKEMFGTGLVEFQSHTFDMHRDGSGNYRYGISKYSGESDEEYKLRLTGDALLNNSFIREHTGVTPLVYAYPMGVYTAQSEAILKDLGFRSTLSTVKGVNALDDGLYLLKRITGSYNVSSSKLIEMMTE